MEKFNNIGSMTLHCQVGKSAWDGLQEASMLAQAVPIDFVNYDFNSVPFPVKNFGNVVKYANEEEMMELYTKYVNATTESDKKIVFVAKLVEAGREKESGMEEPSIDTQGRHR